MLLSDCLPFDLDEFDLELVDEFLLENSAKDGLPGPPPPPADSDDQLHTPAVMAVRSSAPVLVPRCTASKVSNNTVL